VAELQLNSLSKTFRGGIDALRGVSLTVEDREAVFLLGPSGAGKTTTLRLIAGLEDPTSGTIRIGERDVSGLSPRDRNVAMVYDKHSVFPHLTVRENLAYPLRNRRLPASEIAARTSRIAETLRIEALLDRYPSQLSGGQMQRVAIGRALIRDASVYLLDEPISHLDAQLRARMRVEFKRLQREFSATMLYVSHDQLEAMTMADRIVLIRDGRIEQIAPPQELFDRPATRFAACFVGEPAMNVLPAALTADGGVPVVEIAGVRLPLRREGAARDAGLRPGAALVAGFRPQHARLLQPQERGPQSLRGTVFAVEAMGSRYLFDVEVETAEGKRIVRVLTDVDEARRHDQRPNAPACVGIDPDYIYLFDKDTGRTVHQASFVHRRIQ
jgi:multiple sugar transport system ATP-binding protein